MQMLWPGIAEVIWWSPFPCQSNTVHVLILVGGLPNAALNLPNTGTFSALWGDSSSNWSHFFMTCFFSILEGCYFIPVSSPHITLTHKFLPPQHLQPIFVCGLLQAWAFQGQVLPVFKWEMSPAWVEIATLKTSHCLRKGQITNWKSVNHYALDACPYSGGAHGLTLLREMEGKKEKKKKSPGLNPVPWPVAKEVQERRVHLFSLCLLIPECFDLKAPICAPDQAPGRTQSLYFPDQPSKDPFLNRTALGAHGTNVLVSWSSPVRWKWMFRLLLAKLGFVSPLHHCYHFLLPSQPRERAILLPLEPLGPASKTLK